MCLTELGINNMIVVAVELLKKQFFKCPVYYSLRCRQFKFITRVL